MRAQCTPFLKFLDGIQILKGKAHNPTDISEVQRQRVALARALIRRPVALLLDEPFSALDQLLCIEIRHLLKEVRKGFSRPAILVTHDSNKATSLADKIMILSRQDRSNRYLGVSVSSVVESRGSDACQCKNSLTILAAIPHEPLIWYRFLWH